MRPTSPVGLEGIHEWASLCSGETRPKTSTCLISVFKEGHSLIRSRSAPVRTRVTGLQKPDFPGNLSGGCWDESPGNHESCGCRRAAPFPWLGFDFNPGWINHPDQSDEDQVFFQTIYLLTRGTARGSSPPGKPGPARAGLLRSCCCWRPGCVCLAASSIGTLMSIHRLIGRAQIQDHVRCALDGDHIPTA